MSITTFPRISSDAAAPAFQPASARVEFDAIYARCFARAYRFVAARVASRDQAELATRRALTRAACEGVLVRDEAAAELLRIVKAEVARVRREDGARE